MKVLQDGKEVSGATVVYSSMTGDPVKVVIKGSTYSAKLFTFQDEESNKKTKPASRTKKVTKTGDVMTTKSVKKKG